MTGDTIAIIVSIVGTGLVLWRTIGLQLSGLRNDMTEVRRDVGDLRERMARVEAAVEILTKVLVERDRPVAS